MAGVLQHLRSSTLDKRPNPASMVDGQVAINYASGSPGMFFKDSNGNLVKVGPVHVGTTAPNVSPASGGTAGNSKGEQWLDTTGDTYVFKVWDGGAWRSESGTFVDVNGDVMTGALGIIAGSAGSPGLYFSGDTNTGLYSPGADQLAISTNGTGRLFVDSSGNIKVSIGEISQTSATSYIRIDGGDGAGAGANILAFGQSHGSAAGRLVLTAVGSESMQFGAGGAERMRLTSTGALGLGTSSPDANSQLHIVGSSYQPLYVNTTTAGGGGTVFLQSGTQALYTGTAGSSWLSGSAATDGLVRAEANLILATNGNTRAVTIDSSQRVGIGTTSVSTKLHIVSNGAGGDVWVANGSGQNCLLEMAGNGNTPQTSSALYGQDSSNNVYGGWARGAHPVLFGTNGTERGRWDSSGRFLVGTSSSFDADATFQCIGANAAQFFRFGADNAQVIVGSARGTQASPTVLSSTDTIGGVIFRGCGAAGTYYNGASIQAQIDGITPSSDLPTRLVFSTTRDAASSPTEALRIDSNQRVLIGTTSQVGANTTRVDISAAGGSSEYGLGIDVTTLNTATQWIEFSSGGSTARGSIDWSGSAVRYNTSSDYRLKENVIPLADSISRIKALKPCRYNFVEFPDQTVDGFIAHEAQVVVPEAVTGTKDEVNADGNPIYQGIDQSKLVPLLTAALQEALAKIETLEARLTAAGI